MPVTFIVAPGLGVNLDGRSGQSQNATELLQQCSKEQYAECKTMFQSSFSDDYLSRNNVKASPNGFVWAVIEAYNEHRGLVIRPDDVWLAILAQFSIYVNAHTDEHRSKLDWAEFPQVMVSKLEQVIPDPDFQSWIFPHFSTTNANDTVVCSIVMIATLKHYVRYKLYLRCGIPAVKLLGENEETHDWYELLHAVISHFINAFDNPDSIGNKDFWQKTANTTNNMSGVDYLDGWITAFCFWDEQGQRLHGKAGRRGLKLGGIEFSYIEINEIPPGFAAVPVTIDENGYEYPARMVAGSMATRAYISHKGFPSEKKGSYDTLQPEVGWCVFRLKG